MRRRTLLLGVVTLGLALAPAAGADRETSFSDVPSSAVKNELTASIALTPDGAIAAAWSPVTVPGALQGAERVDARWQRWRRAADGQVHGVAVVYDANGAARV